MGIRYRLSQALLGSATANRLRARNETRDISHLPDRRQLADIYIPAIASRAGRILWVGTQPYTAETYAAMEAGGGEVWTTEINPRAARWGKAGRHRIGDVCEADRLFPDLMFDTVVFNGVMGFGLDLASDQIRAIDALARITKGGGVLLLGWNTDKVEDPLAAGWLDRDFTAVGFAGQPSRVAFDGSTHVYDAFQRKAPSLG